MEDFRSVLYQKYVSTFKASFNDISEYQKSIYDVWFENKYLPLLNSISRNSRILEIGCGDGKFLAFLKKNGFENTIGVDISGEQIELAKAKGLNVIQGDVLDFLKQREDTFDAIIAIDTIEHFTKSEVLMLFHHLAKSIKKDGLLIIQTPNGEGLFPGQVIYGDLTHLCIFTESSLRQVLSLYGFSNLGVYETSPLPIGISGKIRAVTWSFIKYVLNLVRMIEGGKGKKIRCWTKNIIAVFRKS